MRSPAKVPSRKRKKRILQRAKGFRSARQIYRKAKETLVRAGKMAYEGRRLRKRGFRRLWITRLTAAAKENGLNYSTLLAKLKSNKVLLNRKMLSEIAIADTKSFQKILENLK